MCARCCASASYELVWSDRVPDAAAVDQTVRLARTLHGVPRRRTARAGLVNAVLRRIADGGRAQLATLDGDPQRLGIRHSLPDWIVDGLVASLGSLAEGVMAASNDPAESALRWNPLKGPREDVTGALPVEWHDDPDIPEAIVLDGPFGIEDSPLWADGRAMSQSRASMLPARVLDPQPGERILDLCAAPGAKSTHLAALSNNAAEIVCVELYEARARALRALGERMGARLDVRVGDGRTLPIDGDFDAVLVDPPCTGLGVLSARPDARWRRRPEALEELLVLQRDLLGRALELTRPGGRVVYSTCTLLADENEGAVAAVDAAASDLTALYQEISARFISDVPRKKRCWMNLTKKNLPMTKAERYVETALKVVQSEIVPIMTAQLLTASFLVKTKWAGESIASRYCRCD